MRPSEEFPGWTEDDLGGLTLTITIGDEEIVLATVTCDPELELYETFVGLPGEATQLGRWDASRARAVEKAERFLQDKLRRLL